MTQVPVIVEPEVEGQQEKRPHGRRIRGPLHLTLLLIMAIWAVPAVGLLVASFRPGVDTARSGWWTALAPPYNFTFENYGHVFSQEGIWDGFLNSLIITIPATVLVVLVAAFAAYAFAWMDFPFRNVLFVVVVGLLVVPLQVTLIPVLSLFRDYGQIGDFKLNGTVFVVWLAHTGYGLPFAVYLLRNYMGSLPRSIFESAAIDGAGPATAFFRLAIPMSVPALASLVIFQFLWVWNDLLVALIYLGTNNENKPVSVALANLATSRGGDYHYLTAAAFISMVIPIIVFFALQRYFIRGITGGAVKG